MGSIIHVLFVLVIALALLASEIDFEECFLHFLVRFAPPPPTSVALIVFVFVTFPSARDPLKVQDGGQCVHIGVSASCFMVHSGSVTVSYTHLTLPTKRIV